MGFKTIISKASTTGNSLRTTIPISIVKQFGLKEGDELEWILKVKSNKMIIEVNPRRIEDD
ncbi:MAG: AbrB/MazE/SpoVT family DNA-binding domain-containing protein [Thermoplasmatales archaeon]|nr:AbrB/MazE/SpoVT family DNA-binding domain-containing protein [Thermoplasmatales archaeon]